MLRMGRNNKPETADQEQAARQTHPASAPPPPQGASAAAAYTRPPDAPATPAPPAAQTTHTPAFATTPTPPRALTETDALARDLKDGLVGGFVGVHSVVSGETNFKGMLRVDGRVAGRVSSQDGTLIVSAGGQVEADIEVAVAKINGTVNGDIRAHERIELGRTARVNGNIQTPALVIEQGAIFEGSCRMTEQRAAEQTQPRTTTTPAPAPRNTSAAARAENKATPAPVRTTPAAAETAPASSMREGAMA